jgi:hypothetical protein
MGADLLTAARAATVATSPSEVSPAITISRLLDVVFIDVPPRLSSCAAAVAHFYHLPSIHFKGPEAGLRIGPSG